MTCPRCRSAMFEEVFEDYGDISGCYAFTGWHCLICGTIIDEVILGHQAGCSEPRSRHARMQIGVSEVTPSATRQNRMEWP